MNNAQSLLFADVPSTAVAFTLFGHDVRWYGILMALGVIIAVLLAFYEVKRKKMNPDTPFDLCLFVIPLGLIGARLYYVLFNLDIYLADPISILYLWEGGLAIYGAVIGGLAGLLIYSKVKKIRLLKLADLVAPGLVLAQAIGRWGNFFNQEAYGPLVTNEAHMWFPLAVRLDSSEIHYATFFYEFAWCLIVFIILWFFIRKRQKHDGDLLLYYTMLYGFGRMFIEGLRQDSLWLIGNATNGGIRVSQMLAFILFALTLAFLIVRAVREKRVGRLIWPTPECSLGSYADAQPSEDNSSDVITEENKEQLTPKDDDEKPLDGDE